ncbi:hypothetical protein V6617_01945 [Pelagibacterium nitratireducens]|uniref:Uncharacterized protein n=1 Tax=Pelagibacterium nitratireducens TaxID=1046114 RepID=A0ABZ2I0B1_9HYPH
MSALKKTIARLTHKRDIAPEPLAARPGSPMPKSERNRLMKSVLPGAHPLAIGPFACQPISAAFKNSVPGGMPGMETVVDTIARAQRRNDKSVNMRPGLIDVLDNRLQTIAKNCTQPVNDSVAPLLMEFKFALVVKLAPGTRV